ncbi:E3 ubiquitin-protein ligase makorin-1-like isoform X2 [Dysidea avara]|uniref:E3 ubiquitin-protein ligase makorin-1-like isoform X2 n=1 Tax=Dysidea avara TaxID=196820 RepID=UPI00331DF233
MEKYPLLCRYFMNGCCKEGDNCLFSHNWTSKPDMVCRYYLKGCCVYGSGCRHDHVKPPNIPSSSSRGEMPAPVSLASMKRQAELEQEGEQEPVDDKSNFTVLSSAKLPDNWEDLTSPSFKPPDNWVDAPEFVPGSSQHTTISNPKEEDVIIPDISSYSEAAKSGTEAEFIDKITPDVAALLLCPFAAKGFCPFGDDCEYLHGLVCDLCGCECLHPYDISQQEEHRKQCVDHHEKEMEKAFAAQRSEGITCSICMEVVLSKNPPSEQRFGILTDCDHPFCLSCIRHWRSSTDIKKSTIRACPICRKVSYFVIPLYLMVLRKRLT